MYAGQLNRLITIKAPPTAQDASGGPTGPWTTVCTTWADVSYLSGSETIKAGADTSIAKVSVRIRYRTGLTQAMRVEFSGTVFQINAVLPDEQGRSYVDLVCEAVG